MRHFVVENDKKVEKEVEAPDDADIPPLKKHDVTSVESCFARFSKKEIMDMRRNFAWPYKECQRRLEVLEKKDAEKKEKQVKESKNEKQDDNKKGE